MANKFKFKENFLSAPYWIHLIIDTIVGQGIWWGVSMLIGTPILVRSIIAGIILIAIIFAVAWYLPKLSLNPSSLKRKESKQLIQSPVPIDTLGWLQSKVNEHWHSPERFVYSRLTKVFLSSPSEIGLVTEWFNSAVFGLKLESVSGEVMIGEVGIDVESIGHQIKLHNKTLLDMCGHCTTTYHIQLVDEKKMEQFRDAILKHRPLVWRLRLSAEISTIGYSRSFTAQSELNDITLMPVAN